jgi:hypothetical protein
LISFQMMRVISSPSSSTTVPSTLIFVMGDDLANENGRRSNSGNLNNRQRADEANLRRSRVRQFAG